MKDSEYISIFDLLIGQFFGNVGEGLGSVKHIK